MGLSNLDIGLLIGGSLIISLMFMCVYHLFTLKRENDIITRVDKTNNQLNETTQLLKSKYVQVGNKLLYSPKIPENTNTSEFEEIKM